MLPAFILSFSAMTIQIAKESRKEAIASIERYCRENFPNLSAVWKRMVC
jgi:hypothetical protein